MDPPHRDPNRFATGVEAVSVRARIAEELAMAEVTRQAIRRAEKIASEKAARLSVTEQQYYEAKAEFDDASNFVRGLQARYNDLNVALESQKALLHPIRRTPREILAYIFELALPEPYLIEYLDAEKAQSVTAEGHKTQFSLAAVCKRWRETSLVSSRAWHTLFIDVDKANGDNVAAWQSMVSCALARSGVVSLNLTIVRTDPGDGSKDDELLELSTQIASAMDRCALLSLRYSCLDDLEFLRPILTHSARKLQRLSFWLPSHRQVSERLDSWSLPILPNAAPHTVHCSGSEAHLLPLSERLRECTLSSVGRAALIESLRRMPSVNRLYLALPDMSSVIPSEPSHNLPSLTSLCVYFADGKPVESLYNVFTTPNLRKLTIWGEYETCTERLDYFLLVRLTTTLVSLKFSALTMELVPDFLVVLGSLSQLTRLGILLTNFDRAGLHALFSSLSQLEEGRWLNPRLTHVSLKGTTVSDDCDIGDVEFFVKTRSNPARGENGDLEFCKLEKFVVKADLDDGPGESWIAASRYMRPFACEEYDLAWRYDATAS